MGTIKYKDYEGTVEYDPERKVLRGKILFISDLVTYEALDPPGIEREFAAAVDDYVDTCALVGKAPQKPCSGQFSVRVPPGLHRKALEKAVRENGSLNAVVVAALGVYLNENSTRIYVSFSEAPPIVATATTSQSTDVYSENRRHVLH
jgi:predicted HicB family RNase H-like nuclease